MTNNHEATRNTSQTFRVMRLDRFHGKENSYIEEF